MQSVDSMSKNSKNSVLPSFGSIILGCFVLSGHTVHNIPNAYSVEREVSTGIDINCANKFGSVFPFCLGETTANQDGSDKMIPVEVIACLGLPLVLLQLKKLSKDAHSKGSISVLPNMYSSALACAILCAHVVHNLPNAKDVQGAATSTLAIGAAIAAAWNVVQSLSGVGKKEQNSILPNRFSSMLIGAIFCSHAAYNSGHLATIWDACPPAAVVLLALSLVIVVAQNVSKEQKSVLPKLPSLLLVCGVMGMHVAQNMEAGTGIVVETKVVPSAATAILALTLLVILGQNRKADQKSVLPKCPSLVLIFATMCAHVAYNMEGNTDIWGGSNAIPSMAPAVLALCFIVVAAQNLMSAKHSVLPKLPSLLLVCAVMGAHTIYNMRHTSSTPSATISVPQMMPVAALALSVVVVAAQNLKSTTHSVLPKLPSLLLVCAIIGTLIVGNMEHSPSISSASRAMPQTALTALALSMVVVAAQNLFKEQHSVLPKSPSLLLACGIMCAHVALNTQNMSGMFDGFMLPEANKVPLSNDMIKMLTIFALAAVVQIVVQQSGSVDKKDKTSVLPNAYSSVIICGIFCMHFAHHFAGFPSFDGLGAKNMSSIVSMEGIGEVLSYMGFPVFSMLVTASRMRSDGSDKTKKVSVMPNLWSIMLISWVLYFHVIHTQLVTIDSASPAPIGSILGAASDLQGFGHKDHASIENIPVEVVAGVSERLHTASPKAIAASVFFAFIAMSLKMGEENKDKKSKKSLLPNSRSMLLICLVLLGHAVHNWPGSSSQDVHEASDYTGVDELSSWDESGPVLPDTTEDLNNLLEASPDVFHEPSVALTSR